MSILLKMLLVIGVMLSIFGGGACSMQMVKKNRPTNPALATFIVGIACLFIAATFYAFI